jgi:glycosyltransferase involved in cell wall biosynthesis
VFGAATALVFASKFEGFGLPILEAFHARLPVICSNASTLPEVAGDAALYFDPDSPEELASLMKAVMDRPDIREDLIKRGTAVLSRYSIDEFAANIQMLYSRTAEVSSQERCLSAASAAI